MCSIYSRRPKACARYRCQLLKDFQAAAVDLPRALEHVATAKRLLARLRRSMPTGMTITEARASIHAQSGSGASELAAMELKLHVFALELYLDRHFRNSRDRRSLVLEAAESESEEN